MQLNDEQKALVAQWVKEGCGLSEIQRRMGDQFKLTLTYMDVRFLVIELGLDIQEKKSSTPPPKDLTARPSPAEVPGGEDEFDKAGLEPEPAPGTGSVVVDVDRLMRPGALVSGWRQGQLGARPDGPARPEWHRQDLSPLRPGCPGIPSGHRPRTSQTRLRLTRSSRCLLKAAV